MTRGPTATVADPLVIMLLQRIAIAVEALAKSRARDSAPDVLTAPQLADQLQVDVRTLRTMRNAREIPRGFMVGRSPRWKRAQIEAWIAKVQR
jgi:predicted DNA-binding transcriptional regulator AlpA